MLAQSGRWLENVGIRKGSVSCVNVGQNVNLGKLYWRLFLAFLKKT